MRAFEIGGMQLVPITLRLSRKMSWNKLIKEDDDLQLAKHLTNDSIKTPLAKGEFLIHQNDPADKVFLVEKGTLAVVRYTENGHEIRLSNLSEGDLIGEMGPLTSEERTSTVVCTSDVEVNALPVGVFQTFFEENAVFAGAVARCLAMRLLATSNQLTGLATLPVEARLHSELLNLGEQSADDEELFSVSQSPTVSELAIRIHATREATSRAMTQLEKKGLVVRSNKQLQVISPIGFRQ